MLTKDDLSQIKTIVQEETRKIVKEELRAEIGHLRKDVGIIVNYFDQECLGLREKSGK